MTEGASEPPFCWRTSFNTGEEFFGMNLRGRAPLHHPGIQLAPLVDVLLLLLIFFLMTWNAARNENELDVKVPKASAAKEQTSPIGDVVVNVRADGNVVVNRRTLSASE